MVKIAILAAAGWKGAGYDFEGHLEGVPEACLPLETCPEALLPLGNGKTILSRLTEQLYALDFADILAVVGSPGCLFPDIRARPGTHHHTTEEQARVGMTDSPWTQERVDYVDTLAAPVLTADPEGSNYLDGYVRGLEALESMGLEWDRVLLMQADMLVTSALLEYVVNQDPGCLMSLHPRHDLFWLTPQNAEDLRRLVESHRLYSQPFFNEGKLLTAGVTLLSPSPAHATQWTDVDYRSDFYRVAIGQGKEPSWMERYGGDGPKI